MKLKIPKCQICKLEVEEELFCLDYINKNGIAEKKGHKKCVEEWFEKSVISKQINEEIEKLKFTLDKTSFVILSNLIKEVGAKTVLEVIKEKNDLIEKNFDKGWRYCFAIIRGESKKVYESILEARKQVESIEKVKTKEDYDYVKVEYRKAETRDISRFL